MRSTLTFAPFLLVSCLIAGCGSGGQPSMRSERGGDPNADIQTIMQKFKLMQEMAANPDLPVWHDQREKMAMAIGDRVIDKSFDRTFDSMIIALGNLGCRVNNMERESGYITASAPQLPPEQVQALHRQAAAQYAEAKGYPADILASQTSNELLGPMGQMLNPADMSGAAQRTTAGLTLTMTRVAPTQTRVKIRFDNVYAPQTVQELYKKVWDALDKQIFLDRSVG